MEGRNLARLSNQTHRRSDGWEEDVEIKMLSQTTRAQAWRRAALVFLLSFLTLMLICVVERVLGLTF